MGLLSTEVEVSVNSQVKYFESLGYEIPRYIDVNGDLRVKRGTTIKVKISDLKTCSLALVPVSCDYCDNKDEIVYQQYYKTTHSNTTDGKYACPSCMKLLYRGEKHPMWKPEKTQKEREDERKYEEYFLFIKKVIARDNYTCKCCGKYCSKDIQVHHLNGYHWYIEGRTDPENAVCLCENCHSNFHSIYGKGYNTKEQFEEWLGKTLENLKYSDEPLLTTRKIYCIEEDIVYDSAMAIKEAFNVKRETRLYKICNYASSIINNKNDREDKKAFTFCGKHFIWFDDYRNMTKDDILKYLEYCKSKSRNRKVICMTIGEVFDSITEAAKHYNCFETNIHKCCNGKYKTCGQLEDGTKLKWMYYDEYIKNKN